MYLIYLLSSPFSFFPAHTTSLTQEKDTTYKPQQPKPKPNQTKP